VACSQCNTPYRLAYPSLTALLALLTRIDELTARAVPIVGTGLVVIGLYWLGVTHGALTIMQVFGRNAVPMLERRHPLLLLGTLPIIPLTLVVVHTSRWRVRLAHQLYLALNRQEFVVGNGGATAAAAAAQRVRIVGVAPAFDGVRGVRTLLAALAMPSIAVCVGRWLFPSLTGVAPLQQATRGLLVVTGVHTVLSVYYRYSQVWRGQKRRILDYAPPPTETESDIGVVDDTFYHDEQIDSADEHSDVTALTDDSDQDGTNR